MVSNIDNAQAQGHDQNMLDDLRTELIYKLLTNKKEINKWITAEINVSIYAVPVIFTD